MGTARFPDHHRYAGDDFIRIARSAAESGAEAVVTTQKDAVKYRVGPADEPPTFSLKVRLTFTSGEDELRRLLRSALRV